jgi:NDP-sugar pyrophosphorylase family protein
VPVRIADWIVVAPALTPIASLRPWKLTTRAAAVIGDLMATLPTSHFVRIGDVVVHRTATIEPGAIVKGPAVVGPRSFVAATAYLRGGCWLEAGCTVGPGVELKSSFVFADTTIAHLGFVGDSVIGARVNLEAGAVICNRRNERGGGAIVVRLGADLHPTGVEKFGALVGDDCRIGAHAVLAPGTLLAPGSVVPRGAVVDQESA